MNYRNAARLVLVSLTTCTFIESQFGVPTAMADDLIVATDATFPPFHYVDDDGDVTGYDVELARAVAERAGLTARIVVLPYDDLFQQLLDGDIDVVAATTGITEERQRKYLFSKAYYDTAQVALVRSGDGEPQTRSDLAGLKVGASGSGHINASDALGDRRQPRGSPWR